MTYHQRERQRKTISRIGVWSFIIGFILLAIGLVSKYLVIATFGQNAVYFGAVAIVIFSRIGWSDSFWKDFILNQFSIILALTGFTILFLYGAYDLLEPKYGILAVVFGILLSVLGMISNASEKANNDKP